MWKTPQDIRNWMEELDATYRCQNSHHGDSPIAIIKGQVVDRTTGRTWAEAEGQDEEDAVRKAFQIALSDPSKRPMTPREKLDQADSVLEENKKLKVRLAALEAKKKVDKEEPATV